MIVKRITKIVNKDNDDQYVVGAWYLFGIPVYKTEDQIF